MKKQIYPTIQIFKYVKIVIVILLILITGYPDNMAAQGQTSDIGEGHSISSTKPNGIYIPINTAFTQIVNTMDVELSLNTNIKDPLKMLQPTLSPACIVLNISGI